MQRQLRLGDTLDDYCPRERRLTNHVIVAMVEADVKQTRCTTCDAEHEYKHARIPRQRKKSEAPAALYAQVLAGGPKRVVPDPEPASDALLTDDDLPQDERRTVEDDRAAAERAVAAALGVDLDRPAAAAASSAADESDHHPADDAGGPQPGDDGFVHRRLIRAQLPRIEGQPPPPRQAPDFTIRQPAGRPGRFRQRGPRPGQGSGQGGGQGFGGRSGNTGGGGPMRSGSRPHGGPHPMNARSQKHQGSGRKRSR